MSIDPATTYRIKNVATGNVMAQSGGWSHNNGLLAYGGGELANDQLWVFVQYDSGYKILNYNYIGWVIADSAGDICVYMGADNADQYWQVGGDGTYITISQGGNSLIDPNPSGGNGSLGTAPTTANANTAVWMAIPQAPS